MKKIFSIVALLSVFSFKSFAAVDGKGQIQLSENVVYNFISYIVGDAGSWRLFGRSITKPSKSS